MNALFNFYDSENHNALLSFHVYLRGIFTLKLGYMKLQMKFKNKENVIWELTKAAVLKITGMQLSAKYMEHNNDLGIYSWPT